ncbi:unnamed protein product, partial [Urochloa humidicola]
PILCTTTVSRGPIDPTLAAALLSLSPSAGGRLHGAATPSGATRSRSGGDGEAEEAGWISHRRWPTQSPDADPDATMPHSHLDETGNDISTLDLAFAASNRIGSSGAYPWRRMRLSRRWMRERWWLAKKRRTRRRLTGQGSRGQVRVAGGVADPTRRDTVVATATA